MSRRADKDPINEAEQQRQRDEEEARRIEARRLEIKQQPNPPEVLQYVSPYFPTLPWSPFGLVGTQESRRTTCGESWGVTSTSTMTT